MKPETIDLESVKRRIEYFEGKGVSKVFLAPFRKLADYIAEKQNKERMLGVYQRLADNDDFHIWLEEFTGRMIPSLEAELMSPKTRGIANDVTKALIHAYKNLANVDLDKHIESIRADIERLSENIENIRR